MDFEKQLDTYLRAKFTLIILITNEEQRALDSVRSVCVNNQRSCLAWDVADYFQWLTPAPATTPTARDPLTALEQIDKFDPNSNTIFLLKDFHDLWDNAQIKRKLRRLAQRLKFTRKSILITTYVSKIPEELKDEAVVVNFPLPTAEQLEKVLNDLTQTAGVKVNLTELGREKLVHAALGLTPLAGAARHWPAPSSRDGTLDDRDIDLVTEEKKQIIRESEALEFYRGHRDARRRRRSGRAQGMAAHARDGLHPEGARLRPAGAQGHRPDRHPRHRQEPDRQDDRRAVAHAAAAPGRGRAVRQPGGRVGGAHPPRPAPGRNHRPLRAVDRRDGKSPGSRRAGQRHQHARLRHHPHLDAGEDRASASSSPPPTTSPACRPSCCAGALRRDLLPRPAHRR